MTAFSFLVSITDLVALRFFHKVGTQILAGRIAAAASMANDSDDDSNLPSPTATASPMSRELLESASANGSLALTAAGAGNGSSGGGVGGGRLERRASERGNVADPQNGDFADYLSDDDWNLLLRGARLISLKKGEQVIKEVRLRRPF